MTEKTENKDEVSPKIMGITMVIAGFLMMVFSVSEFLIDNSKFMGIGIISFFLGFGIVYLGINIFNLK